MYKVAVIQNQSEAFELSYGNSYKFLQAQFPYYEFDLFSTVDGMQQLLAKAEDYDAIVFTSDALGDTLIRNFWLSPERETSLLPYLQSGKGLLVLHQDKMVEEIYSFLGKDLTLVGVPRTRTPGDYPGDGTLSQNGKHMILQYPDAIDLIQIASQGRNNPQVTGVYWHYLKSFDSENWISVIRDNTYQEPRNILLISGPRINARVIVTSLALERQDQIHLLKNLLTYAVEGTQSLAIIRRRETIPYDFRYFLNYLNVNKVAYREYKGEDISQISMVQGVHSVVVIDPSWRESDLTSQVVLAMKTTLRPEGKIIYFGNDQEDDFKIITLGGKIPFRTQYRDVIFWVKSIYDRQVGLWDGSFFSTVHVIELLQTLQEPLDEYKEKILNYVYKHDLNGSYDNVFGATCELARIYFLFNEQGRLRGSINWIKKELNQFNKPLSDVARALATLSLCGVIIDTTTLHDLILRNPLPDAETDLIRLLRASIQFKFSDSIQSIVQSLINKQEEDGSWGKERVNRIMLTASVTEALILARQLMTSSELRQRTEDCILNGITYLENFNLAYAPYNQKAATVAIAMLALYRFENEIKFPIEDFVISQRILQQRTINIATSDAATTLIVQLEKEKKNLDKEHSLLVKEHSQVEYFRAAASWLTLVLLALATTLGLVITYSVIHLPEAFNYLGTIFSGIFYNWLLPYWWVIAAVAVIWIMLALARVRLLPRIVFTILELIGKLFGLNLKADS